MIGIWGPIPSCVGCCTHSGGVWVPQGALVRTIAGVGCTDAAAGLRLRDRDRSARTLADGATLSRGAPGGGTADLPRRAARTGRECHRLSPAGTTRGVGVVSTAVGAGGGSAGRGAMDRSLPCGAGGTATGGPAAGAGRMDGDVAWAAGGASPGEPVASGGAGCLADGAAGGPTVSVDPVRVPGCPNAAGPADGAGPLEVRGR